LEKFKELYEKDYAFLWLRDLMNNPNIEVRIVTWIQDVNMGAKSDIHRGTSNQTLPLAKVAEALFFGIQIFVIY